MSPALDAVRAMLLCRSPAVRIVARRDDASGVHESMAVVRRAYHTRVEAE
jgi:hypothetical protein